MPELSVAMCTFNGERFLAEQLLSIASQTRLPDELVICDDASSDATADIINAFRKSAPFEIRFEINRENLGSTRNFEKAISLCRGRLIALSDQDDVWNSNKLETLVGVLDRHPEAGYVFSDAEVFNTTGGYIGSHWRLLGFDEGRFTEFLNGNDVAILLKQPVVTGATMLFRATLTKDLLPIARYRVHDYWISLVASCIGARGIPINQKLIRYRQHDSQQIGLRTRSLAVRIKQSRNRANSDLALRARFYEDVAQRISGRSCPTRHMTLLKERIKHDSCRADLRHASGVSRMVKVFSELCSGRYSRFSESWLSIITDLCS